MLASAFSARVDKSRAKRKTFHLACEALEDRLFLNATQAHVHAVHEASTSTKPPMEVLSGRITNQVTGKGVNKVRVQLINSVGQLVRTTFTNSKGNYSFKVPGNRPFVVREVTPKGLVQVSPEFVSTAPVGAFAPGFDASNFNFRTGNSNPANGPVGPPFWNTIAPAGNLPFEAPINITGPSIDLSKVLSINYNNAVPKQIINNGAQIQVQITSSASDTIDLGGTTYNLSQFHYHDPSENHVDGITYNMEEHFVNVSSSGAATVVAVFLQLGAHNNALDPILNAATADLTMSGSSTNITSSIDFAGLLPSSLQGWYFQGSLTTPPLAQPLNWLVLATPITLDSAQLAQYEAVADGAGFLPGARPIQPSDGRQLNEVDFDLNVQDTSISGLNFVLGKGNTTGLAPSLGSSNIHPLNDAILTGTAGSTVSTASIRPTQSDSEDSQV
jgi:carbonic anhydrase